MWFDEAIATLGRWAAIVRASLKAEKQMAGRPRPHHEEIEFLPAALEVLESPASPTARYTFWAMTSLIAVALAWSFIGELDVVAVAEGRTVPAGRTKIIQPLDTGIVQAIYVQDGQGVRAGDPLINLDSTVSSADVRRLIADLTTLRVDVARLSAASHPDRVPGNFDVPAGTPHALAEMQRALLASQAGEYLAKLAGMDADRARLEADRKGVDSDIDKLTHTIPLLRQRSDARTQLAEKGFGSRLTALELQQQMVEMQHELQSLRHKREETSASIEASFRQRKQVESEYLKAILTQRNDAVQKVAEIEEDLLKAEQKRSQQTLTAPIDGVVQQLAVHTIGGVVTPAQALMAIVPAEDELEVEAMVQNKDIGFIQVGQEVEVKLETFLFTKYGTIPGRVTSVSRDAVKDEKKGYVYPARIRLDRTRIDVDGRQMQLGAGMALTAEIKTDRRRVIDYLLSPIARYRQESLRER